MNTALTESNAEDRIITRPGTYTDPATVKKNVRLIGEGPLENIRLQVDDHTSATIRTETCHIENISIQQTGTQESFALDIAFGNSTIRNSTIKGNTISENGTIGIAIQTHSKPEINNNTIEKNNESGVVISDNGQGTLKRNAILGNGFSGIEISKGAVADIKDNQISWNKGGIMAHQNAGGVISNNDLRYNKNGAFYISDNSVATVTRSGNIELIQASFN